MLPTTPVPNTRLTVDAVLQPVRATTQILDVLSEFVPGQKMMAEIQFQLANGAYRATIAQRDVTLALPFSAKPGDSLELEVVETEGRIAFAIAKPPADPASTAQASSSTTLSRTGQMIGNLLQNSGGEAQKPAPLNAGQPIVQSPSIAGAELAPALKEAVSRSGLFYESHQARWAAGKFPEAALRTEPQALVPSGNLQQIPGRATLAAAAQQHSTPGSPGEAALLANRPTETPANAGSLRQQLPETMVTNRPGAVPTELAGQDEMSRARLSNALAESGNPATSARQGGALPAEIAPIVQQQLSSLASNIYPFQGAIWPGQQILWEIIDEDGGQESQTNDDMPRQWKTRLKVLLPSLGDIDATVQLEGNDLRVQIKSSESLTQNRLKGAVDILRSRLDLAGLRLTGLDVKGYDETDPR